MRTVKLEEEERPPLSRAEVPGGEVPLGTERARNPKQVVKPSKLEQHERRKAMVVLDANRMSLDDMVEAMTKRFPTMTATAVRRLRDEVREELVDLDKEALPLIKQRQLTRLHRQIVKAEKSESWNAVAALERTYAAVAGTLEPLQVNVNVDATLREAVTHVLAGLTPDQLQGLVAGQLTAPPATPINTEGEAVEAAE